jgi:ABC-type antimicrobial peptide transport system permease subunit
VTALTLAIIGVYGLIAHTAVERSHEIGVRMALGASRVDIMRLIMGAGLGVTLAGVLVGSMVSLALTRLIRGMLFGVTPLDGYTFAAVSALMLLTAALACFLPARRATKIDPVTALRAT